MTAPGHKPSRDWLNFVVTSRARNKIRHYIQGEEKVRSTELGRKLFEKEARRFGLNMKSLMDGEAFAKAAERVRHAEGGRALRRASATASCRSRPCSRGWCRRSSSKEAPPETGIASVVRRVLGTGEEKIKVRGVDDLMVFRARCCNPIRGEQIVGYITRGKGVSVHSAACPNVVNLLYDPERRIDVEWDKGARRRSLHRAAEHPGGGPQGHPRRRQLEDRRHQHQHPEGRGARPSDQMGRIDMTVEISDVKHLQKVIKSLRGVEGVIDVERASR